MEPGLGLIHLAYWTINISFSETRQDLVSIIVIFSEVIKIDAKIASKKSWMLGKSQ